MTAERHIAIQPPPGSRVRASCRGAALYVEFPRPKSLTNALAAHLIAILFAGAALLLLASLLMVLVFGVVRADPTCPLGASAVLFFCLFTVPFALISLGQKSAAAGAVYQLCAVDGMLIATDRDGLKKVWVPEEIRDVRVEWYWGSDGEYLAVVVVLASDKRAVLYGGVPMATATANERRELEWIAAQLHLALGEPASEPLHAAEPEVVKFSIWAFFPILPVHFARVVAIIRRYRRTTP